ncbi:MAG: GDP-mannose 4,6-dehydratase [Anaerolineales bacterium]|nr:GDP-mannose 4,6-dehydratase [Anaerolineales bacterium]
MSRILITGVHGFVGSHLAYHLKSMGGEVFGFDLRATSSDKNFYQGELTDRNKLKQVLEDVKPDIVFHLAGVIKSSQSEILYKANFLGTVALLDQIMESDRRPIVIVASSSAVYGHKSGAKPISERTQLHPLTDYAVSKAAQELAALRYYESFNLPVIIVRMFNLLGPGQPADLACSAFARQIALGELNGQTEIVTGNLDARRDFVDVRDAVRAFELVAERGKAGQVYNVCSGRVVSIRACLDRMIDMSPHQFAVRVDAEKIQKNDVPIQVGSSLKLSRVTGWRPQISFKQSLSDLLDDWRQRVKSELE